MKKTILSISVSLVILLGVVTTALAAESDLVNLTIINNTSELVWISITNSNNINYLSVAAGDTKLFTVPRGSYDMTASACGHNVEGTFDLSSQVQLRFMPCTGSLVNQGAPTLEKVNLLVPPPLKWRFQFKLK